MIKGLELRRPSVHSWVDCVYSHIATSKTGLNLSYGELQEYLKKLRANIEEITTVPADEFLDELIRFGNQLQPIGRDGIRREGLFFGILQPDHTRLVKLFGGSKLGRQFISPLLQQLYPQEEESKRIMGILPPFQVRTTPDRARQKIQAGSRNDARYLASAEIAVRTIAHTVLPEQMPIPRVIIDPDLEAIGFYLDHEAPFSTALDSQVESTFFDGDTAYPLNSALPGEAKNLRNALMPYNVHIYNETEGDIRDQVLLTKDGGVLNVSRLGYSLT